MFPLATIIFLLLPHVFPSVATSFLRILPYFALILLCFPQKTSFFAPFPQKQKNIYPSILSTTSLLPLVVSIASIPTIAPIVLTVLTAPIALTGLTVPMGSIVPTAPTVVNPSSP